MKYFLKLTFVFFINLPCFAQLENIPLLNVYGEYTEKVKPDYLIFGFRVNKQMVIGQGGNISELVIFDKNDTKINLFDFNDKNITESLVQVDSVVYVKEVFITIYDLSKVEKYLLELYGQGIRSFSFWDYRVADLDNHLDNARKNALLDAKKKANLLGEQLGQSVGKVHSVEEIPVANYNWYNINKEKEIENLTFKLGRGSYVIEPGYVTITAKLKVSFELGKE